jgi:hypothetical protein
MTKETIEGLTQRRSALTQMIDAMNATPELDRPQKPSARKAWLTELDALSSMVAQLDDLIKRLTPKPSVETHAASTAQESMPSDVVTLARVPKGRRAEVRVSVKPWRGRQIIDIRLWSLIDGAGVEMRPSRKGIAFDASKLDALIDALHQAKQHV